MTIPITLIVKDPQSSEPRGFDYTEYLAELSATETISTSTWAVTGPDAVLTLGTASIVNGAKKTQVILVAGTARRQYLVTNHIVTSGGTVDDRSFPVLVQDR